MKLFECQNCGHPLYFENTKCESCGLRLGFLPARETISALQPDNDLWQPLAAPKERYRFCANAEHDVCNWMVGAEDPDQYCAACRHNRTIPDLSVPGNREHWHLIEIAKHRLFYTLLKLQLPLVTKAEDPDGLAFDFLAAPAGPAGPPIMTGHANGLITLALVEADDAERERQRHQMGEPYRTLLGHFRHEIAHYYWSRLIADSDRLAAFRDLFGDERKDYAAALQEHYAKGAPPDWPSHFVTAYASAHPWEDFAETWAHYFHMIDTLETAAAFGVSLRPKLKKGADIAAKIDFDPYRAEMERIIEAWLPLTFAVNSINRSMGLPDLYPFVLAPTVIGKLTFVHDRIRAQRSGGEGDGALRAMIAGLKQRIGSPGTT
ncbi:MAG TPA: putative zinc-binding peptidase [Xanthobacteraceae bacterium]|nr:putative zinc-binding peptidase [Xanthobacteraceae bacterium]